MLVVKKPGEYQKKMDDLLGHPQRDASSEHETRRYRITIRNKRTANCNIKRPEGNGTRNEKKLNTLKSRKETYSIRMCLVVENSFRKKLIF